VTPFFAIWFCLGVAGAGLFAYYAMTGNQVRGWPRSRSNGEPLRPAVAWLVAANYLLLAVLGLLFFPWH
jgi:hypothetical protein